MNYRSDRQRVEAMLIPQMVLGVLICGVNDPNHPDAVAAKQLLVDACEEALIGVGEPQRSKLIRRMVRVHEEVTGPYKKEGHRVDKVGVIVYFLIKAVTDWDYMVIGNGSAFQRALDLFMPAIEHTTDDKLKPLFDSARKQARKVLDHLQQLGYFSSVPFSP